MSAPPPAELFLVLCALPAGVRARNEALDSDLELLTSIAQAVRDELGNEPTGDEDADARVLVAVHLVA